MGDRIRTADGGYGVVEGISILHTAQPMYNLTVDTAHTFFVGGVAALVHNCSDTLDANGPVDYSDTTRPYRNPEVDRARRSIDDQIGRGRTSVEVHVSDRATAEQLFYEGFYNDLDPISGARYANTTGQGYEWSQQYYNRKEGLYHWDDDVEPVGNYLRGHESITARHAQYRHLQIQDWDGRIIRVTYGSKLDLPPQN